MQPVHANCMCKSTNACVACPYNLVVRILCFCWQSFTYLLSDHSPLMAAHQITEYPHICVPLRQPKAWWHAGASKLLTPGTAVAGIKKLRGPMMVVSTVYAGTHAIHMCCYPLALTPVYICGTSGTLSSQCSLFKGILSCRGEKRGLARAWLTTGCSI